MRGMVILQLLYLTGGFLFLVSLGVHVYVRVSLRPRGRSDLDDVYYEFEDRHPAYARYTRWLQISLGGAAAGLLLMTLGFLL